MSSLSVVCIFKPRTICILIYLRDFRGKKKGFYLPAALTTDLYLSRWFTTKKKNWTSQTDIQMIREGMLCYLDGRKLHTALSTVFF